MNRKCDYCDNTGDIRPDCIGGYMDKNTGEVFNTYDYICKDCYNERYYGEEEEEEESSDSDSDPTN